MKKVIIPALCLLLALLCSCGKTPAPAAETTEASSAAGENTSGNAEQVSWDEGDFKYLKGDLPDGWTIDDVRSDSMYVLANFGDEKEENAPVLSVGVQVYDDYMGADKSKLIADKVHERESENASKIETLKIGGLTFYHLSYNSLLTEGKRCHIFFGQTAPDKDKKYNFVEIQLDNIQDDKQYESLKSVLDQLSFKF